MLTLSLFFFISFYSFILLYDVYDGKDKVLDQNFLTIEDAGLNTVKLKDIITKVPHEFDLSLPQ